MEGQDSVQYIGIPVQLGREIRNKFDEYAIPFLSNKDEVSHQHIRLKYEHILHVCDEIQLLGRSFNMNSEELAFAVSIALVHDIGRFEQFEKYGTYADAESENHSLISIMIMDETGISKKFSPEQLEVFHQSVLNHNKAAIPDSANGQVRFYSGLLRDADKLDIWRVSLEYNIFHKLRTGELPDNYIVPHELMTCFSEGKIIRLNQVQSFYDSILFRLSWLYDLNYSITLREFSKRRISARLLGKLPDSPDLRLIQEYVDNYLSRRL